MLNSLFTAHFLNVPLQNLYSFQNTPKYELVFTGHRLSYHYDWGCLPHACPSIAPPPLFCRSCMAYTSVVDTPFLCSCAACQSCRATILHLNSTRSISFHAVQSPCYSVTGHAISICHRCVSYNVYGFHRSFSHLLYCLASFVCLCTRQRHCIRDSHRLLFSLAHPRILRFVSNAL